MILLAINLIELWNNSWPAGVAMLALGTGFSIVLLIASEKLKIKADDRVEQVTAALPNANCGACGFAGCSQYAKAVVENPSLVGKCAPGGSASAGAIAAILNLAPVAPSAPLRAVVHCKAHSGDKKLVGSYSGVTTCTNAHVLASAQACAFGCLGFGDCFKACKFDAITVADGLATVDYEKCTGCGACAAACPRRIIDLAPFAQDNIYAVACSSKENGRTTKANCSVGCIGCGLCAKQSALFTVKDNLAMVDYKNFRPGPDIETAAAKCPTAVIIELGSKSLAAKTADETVAV